MAEMTRSGLDVDWSSLSPAERRAMMAAYGLFALGGAVVGFLLAWRQEQTVGPALALTPLIPLVAGGWIWIRFSRRQDEFHKHMGGLAAKIAYWVTLAVAVPAGLVEGLSGIELVPTWAVALATVMGGGIGWMVAARRYMGPAERGGHG